MMTKNLNELIYSSTMLCFMSTIILEDTFLQILTRFSFYFSFDPDGHDLFKDDIQNEEKSIFEGISDVSKCFLVEFKKTSPTKETRKIIKIYE